MFKKFICIIFLLFAFQTSANAQSLKNISKELKRAKKKVDKGLTKARESTSKELTKARENTSKELTKARENTSKELTIARENISRELTNVKENIDRELTDYKNDLDQTLTIARKDLVTEWNYFWGTVCGESSERKSIQRRYNQDKISREERDELLKNVSTAGCQGGGIQVNSNGDVVLTDNQGRPSEKPQPHISPEEELAEILQWNNKVYMDDWEKAMSEKYVAGWLISPGLRGGISWFLEKPGNVTKTNLLRESKNGHPMTGSRRIKIIYGNNGKPMLDSNGNTVTAYRLHKGTDYAAMEGDLIYAAIDGDVQYIPNVHKGFDMIRIVNRATGHRQETLYVKNNSQTAMAIKNGVKRGDVIGIADNIQRHDSYKNIPNHVHVNFISPEGVYIAPNNKFGVATDSDWVAAYCEDSVCLSPNAKD